MKYKVGDKVRIIPDLKIGQGSPCASVVRHMLKYAGIETRIIGEMYHLQCDDGDWWWPEEVLLPANLTRADKIRQMTDEELAEFLSKTFSRGYGKDSILEWLRKPQEL